MSLPRYSDAAFNVLQYDMLQERASSLSHHARVAEAAMRALQQFDATGGGTEDDRRAVLRKAAGAVWDYFVQREACGMRDHREIVKDFGITGEVLVRLGAIER